MQKKPPLSRLTCSIVLSFPPEELERGLQLLLSSIGVIEAKTGCHSCTVACDAVEGARVRYRETWTSEVAFQRHVLSSEFHRVLIAMELCREEPQVEIGEFSGHNGLSYLQELCERREAG